MGLRNEYTDADFQTNKGLDGRVNYNKFLPSATVTYTHDKNHTFYLHASKRFTRPSFFSYDPTIMVEQTDVWSSGNQHLKPMDYFISHIIAKTKCPKFQNEMSKKKEKRPS